MVQGQNYCTGTFVTPTRIVTAAHCLEEFTPAQMTFAIGPDVSAPTKTYQVVSGAQNPAWNSTTLDGDIAYLDINTTATETPLNVLAGMDSTWVNVNLTFVGYGVDDGQRQSGNGVKRAVVMPISEMGAAQFAYETAGMNTCSGDSGGPGFFIDNAGNYLLAGITSYGDANCTQYGVDTIVSVYASWLGVTPVAPASSASTGTGSTGTGSTDTGSGSTDTGSGSTDTGSGSTDTGSGSTDTGSNTTGCGSETFVGRCDGNIVHWCENNTQYEVDCTTRNKECVYSPPDGYYGCAVPQQPPADDPCQGETYQGRCDGTTIIWCQDNLVQQLACALYGGSCGWDATRQVNNCLYGQ